MQDQPAYSLGIHTVKPERVFHGVPVGMDAAGCSSESITTITHNVLAAATAGRDPACSSVPCRHRRQSAFDDQRACGNACPTGALTLHARRACALAIGSGSGGRGASSSTCHDSRWRSSGLVRTVICFNCAQSICLWFIYWCWPAPVGVRTNSRGSCLQGRCAAAAADAAPKAE